MVTADKFLTALEAKLPHLPTRRRYYLGEFVLDIEGGRVYIPRQSGVHLADLMSDPKRMIEAFYFVTQVDVGIRSQRISVSGAFPGDLSPYELRHIREFVTELRHMQADEQSLDPETLIIPCNAPVMLVMTTVQEGKKKKKKSHVHEFYLLLHNDLGALHGLQLLHASMRSWYSAHPTDPTFYGVLTWQ